MAEKYVYGELSVRLKKTLAATVCKGATSGTLSKAMLNLLWSDFNMPQFFIAYKMKNINRFVTKKIVAIIYLSIVVILFLTGCFSNKRDIENIKVFAKLYGYVRWFHPSDEAQQINWEKLAIYGVKKVENAPNDKALRDSLLELFLPIAPSLKISVGSNVKKFDISEITPTDTSGYMPIAWQHKGIELNTTFYPEYQSIRLNRQVRKSYYKFPQVYYQLNIDRTWGKNFQLKFDSKGEKDDSIGVFLLSTHTYNLLDLPAQIRLKYFKCTGEWEQNEVNSLAASGDLLVFGVEYNGNQSVLFDNVSLEFEDRSNWKNIEVENPGLNAVTNNCPDGFHCCSDLNYSIGSKKLGEKDYCLQISKTNKKSLFKEYPKFGEIIEEKISNGLSTQLPLVLFGNDTMTFPKADFTKLNKLKNELKKDLPVRYERLGSIVILWNIFQHFYPYFDEVEVDWESELTEAITDTYNDKNEYDFLKSLRKFTAKLKDGHIFIEHGSDKWNCLPVAWEWIEDELVVTGIFDSKTDIQIGDKVKRINDISAKKYFNEVKQYISAATLGYLDYYSQIKSVMGEASKECSIEYLKSDGKLKKTKITHSMWVSAYYQQLKKNEKLRFLANKIIYLNLDRIKKEEIDSLLPKMLNSKGIICDLRGYPADNVVPFIKHLLNEKDTAKWMSIQQVIYPNHKRTKFVDFEGWQLEPAEPQIKVPVVFITNGSAISYAESILGIVKYYKLGTIIGQPTAGTNGNVNSFTLPGDYKVRFTGMKVIKLDGSQHHGVGVLPDIYVEKTIRGVREGRDEYLEKAIEFLNKK